MNRAKAPRQGRQSEAAPDPKDLLLVERELARRRARQDPEVFARIYLPHYVGAASAPFHRELYALMRGDATPAGLSAAVEPCAAGFPSRLALAAPRGHAKSTLVSLIFALWLAATRRRGFIVIVGDTAAQAEMFLEALRLELEYNGELRADFGETVGAIWRQDHLLTAGPRRCCLLARGTGSSLRGVRSGTERPDLILCDDIENEENTASAEQRRKVWRWFTRTLINSLAPDGAVWVIGTILHHDALLHNLVHGNAEGGIAPWPGKVWRALEETAAAHGEGTAYRALWPALWPVKKLLARRREIGSLAFAQEFQNQPCAPEEAVFRAEWFEDPETWYQGEPWRRAGRMEFYQAVDPAISRRESADYFCHVTVARDPGNGEVYVVEIVRERLSFERQVALVLEQAERWRPARIGIESVAYQAGLGEAVTARAPLPVVMIRSPRDKFTRALRLAAVIENRKLKLRRGDAAMLALRDELLEFPHGAHDDQVDALGYAVELAAQRLEPRLWML